MTSSTISYGDIKLFAGSSCPELAQRISDHLNIPLSLEGYRLSK